MLPDRVSNPGPLIYESGALSIALRGPACFIQIFVFTTNYQLKREHLFIYFVFKLEIFFT